MVVRVKCESECNGWVFRSVPFVVLIVDQFVGRGGGPLKRQKQEKAIEFLTCDARNVSFGNSLQWPGYIINSVDKTKFSRLR